MLRNVVESADELQVRKLVRDSLNPRSALLTRFPNPIDSILNLGILGLNTYDRIKRMSAVLDEITQGLSWQLLDAWDGSVGKSKDRTKGTESVYFENFSAICQLEKQRPGITRVLMEKYRIFNFARYPIDLLIDQYNSRDEASALYGVIASARHDHNGAFLNIKDQIGGAYQQAKELGFGLKVLEVEDFDEMRRLIERSAENHGPISFALVMAHGDQNFVTLGGDFLKGIGYYELSADLTKFKDTFIPSASICLISCSTGVENGIGQRLSIALPGTEIHSPDNEAMLREKGIIIEMVEGRLRIKVLFYRPEGNYNTVEDLIQVGLIPEEADLITRTFAEHPEEIPTRVYRDGEQVNAYARK